MRGIYVLILVAIVGFVGFVFIFKPDWVRKAKKEVEAGIQVHLEGYGPAKTPREAMDQFLKAIKERNYKAAATYSTHDYADKLTRAHTACRSLGQAIDTLNNYIDEKGFKNDKCTELLLTLDPFPPYLKIVDQKEVRDKQVGAFILDPPKITEGYQQIPARLDVKLLTYKNALGAPAALFGALRPTLLEIKSEGAGDNKIWKIDFNVPQPVHDGITWYMDNYKSYLEGLETFRGELRQGRWLKDQIAGELLDALGKSK
jgi:hypothetical protein